MIKIIIIRSNEDINKSESSSYVSSDSDYDPELEAENKKKFKEYLQTVIKEKLEELSSLIALKTKKLHQKQQTQKMNKKQYQKKTEELEVNVEKVKYTIKKIKETILNSQLIEKEEVMHNKLIEKKKNQIEKIQKERETMKNDYEIEKKRIEKVIISTENKIKEHREKQSLIYWRLKQEAKKTKSLNEFLII